MKASKLLYKVARLSKGTLVIKDYLQRTTTMAISGSRGNSKEVMGAKADQALL